MGVKDLVLQRYAKILEHEILSDLFPEKVINTHTSTPLIIDNATSLPPPSIIPIFTSRLFRNYLKISKLNLENSKIILIFVLPIMEGNDLSQHPHKPQVFGRG